MDADIAFRSVCRAIVLPPGGTALLVVAGVLARRRWPRLGVALVATGLGVLMALSVPNVAALLVRSVAVYPPLDLDNPPRADLIAVLGGGVEFGPHGAVDATVSRATLERLAYAAKLARLTHLPVLLSGGAVAHDVAESQVMAGTLRQSFGIEARWLETRSRDTHENARYSAALLAGEGHPRVLLVTSATHMPRSLAEFRAAGVDVLPAPAPGLGPPRAELGGWLPQAGALERSCEALYEVLGQLVAALWHRA
jgi:uncharacterized SAM-binding protein YcdF (DUF218 family)